MDGNLLKQHDQTATEVGDTTVTDHDTNEEYYARSDEIE